MANYSLMKSLLVVCFVCLGNSIFGQALQCSDAPVLCSLSELDGFSSTMPITNPFDEPAPLCPNGGNPQNMSWFAFIAGSSSAVLELVATNCSGGGIQYGIYEDCTFSNSVVCVSNAVNVPGTITININGMTPGDDYFFFIDGDLGTVCDYSINVVSGGEPVPVPQPTAIECSGSNCPDDNSVCLSGESYTFFTQGLDLTIEYSWTITPPPSGTTNPTIITGDNEYSITFSSPGNYMICATATNGCTTTDEVCTTFEVFESDAGTIVANPQSLCPGETSSISVTGYTNSASVSEMIVIVGPDGVVLDVHLGDQLSVTYPSCGTITAYSYNYITTDNPGLPSVGTPFVLPNCTLFCCDLSSTTVNFEDNESPTFSNTPSDITLDCTDVIPPISDLTWTDNCDGTGSVSGTETSNVTTCQGGTITREWFYVDMCMNIANFTQIITINPQDGGMFLNIPDALSVDCLEDVPSPVDLVWNGDCEGSATVSPSDMESSDLCNGGTVTRTWMYTDPCGDLTTAQQIITINPQTGGDFINVPSDITLECNEPLPPIQDLSWIGDCGGSASVVGVQSGSSDLCTGGNITRTWSYTDACNNLSTHVQTITINPPPEPVFIDAPMDAFYECAEFPNSFPTLQLSNGQSGDCLITGEADPEIMGNPTLCGGTISVIWIFTDPCNRVVSHVQNITILSAEAPTFIDAPADMTISCVQSLPTIPELQYSNGQTGFCAIAGTIMPLVTTEGDICGGDIVSIWEFTDPCGNIVSHVQTIIIEPLAEPSFVNPPDDITIECGTTLPPPMDLDYTNGESGSCEIVGSVSPSISGSSDICGGTVVYTWEFTDLCGRTFTHVRSIVVEPPLIATWIDPPANVTISCDELPPSPPNLSYSNNLTVPCNIQGSVVPTTTDNSNSCGGNITYQWEFVDECGRMINHSQVITIMEAPVASFIDPPVDISVTCENIPLPASALSYTNNDDCVIMGSVSPTITENYDICGGTITNSWTFEDECDRTINHVQIITVAPAPIAAFTTMPPNTSVACEDYVAETQILEYSNGLSDGCAISGSVSPTQSGSFDECGGEVFFTWQFTDECNRIIQHVKSIIIEPSPIASFINPPIDITVSCNDYTGIPGNLSYTNNETGECQIAGNVSGTVIGSPNPCGQTVTFRWEFVDGCGRSITHNQLVTIEEAPMAAFINPPIDVTLNCNQINPVPPSLSYSNSYTGICAISGSVNGFQSGAYDECGGSLIYSWTFTDICNRTITASQNITVLPASEPIFIDLPPDITLDCGETYPPDPALSYTNGQSGNCSISGNVIATSTINGSVTTYLWEFTNPCSGASISYSQNVTGISTPELEITPVSASMCLGETFDLSSIMVVDLNGSNLTLTYADGSGSVGTLVTPSATTAYTITGINDVGCSDDVLFTLVVDTPPTSGQGTQGTLCADFTNYNLYDYLLPPFDFGGVWSDDDNTGVNLDNPTAVVFNNVETGIYSFTYTVSSTNSCPPSSTTIAINVISEIFFEVTSATCDPGGATYSVDVLSYGYLIVASEGTVNVIDDEHVTISGVPAGVSIVVSAFDPVAFCGSNIFVNAPDCDCPTVPLPVPSMDINICEGTTIPAFSVTVGAGLSANWYDAPSGGNLLAASSLTYTPVVSAPGVYNFYVEAVDENGCVSISKVEVSLTIFMAPGASDETVIVCQDIQGTTVIMLQQFNSIINPNPAFAMVYYLSLTDAQSENNPLSDSYELVEDITLFVTVTNTVGCTTIAQLGIDLSPMPTYDTSIMDESCLGVEDGSISLSNILPTGTNFSIDGLTFSQTSGYSSLSPGTYNLFAQNDDNCVFENAFEIGNGLSLNYSELEIICSDNDTPSDSGDDIYLVWFLLENDNMSGSQVSITSNGSSLGNFPYGIVSLTVDAGASTLIVVTDIDNGCTLSIDLGSLPPCSTDCVLTIDAFDTSCNDNGTLSDPTDDYYTIFVNASAVNGAANNSFNVSINNAIVANFVYGIGGEIQVPAIGQTILVSISDNADGQCFQNQSVGPLNPCSDDCNITIDNQNLVCNNNGTAGVATDDFYTFSFNVLATNSSTSFNVLVDNVLYGSFDYGVVSSVDIPASGSSVTIIIEDSIDSSCFIELTTPVLTSCSGSCSIVTSVLGVLCDNNGTANDPSDDIYNAEVLISVLGGSGQWSIVDLSLSGTSGTSVIIGPFDINSGNVTIEVTDFSNVDCNTTLEIVAPQNCSICDETVDAGMDRLLDCTITEVTLTGSSSAPGIYFWHTPDGQQLFSESITVSSIGQYVFGVDFGDECIFYDTLEITVSDEVPIVDAGNDGILDCKTGSITLEGTITGGSGNFDIVWTDGNNSVISTSLTVDVSSPGFYALDVIDNTTNCKAPTAIVQVIDGTMPPSAIIYVDPSNALDCVVKEVILSYIIEDNVEYIWRVDGQEIVTENLVFDKPVTVGLLAIDTLSGCRDSSLLEILDFEEYPIVNVESSGILNCAVDMVILDGSTSQNGQNIIYTWLDESSNIIDVGVQEITVSEDGTYYLQLIDTENNCTNIDTITVSSDYEIPILDIDNEATILCDNQPIILSAEIESIDSYAVAWTTSMGNIINGQATNEVIVGQEGVYFVTAINLISFCSVSDTVEVTLQSTLGDVDISTFDESCDENLDGVIVVNAIGEGTPPYEYFLDASMLTTNTVEGLAAGEYQLTIIDSNDCTFDTLISIETLPPFEVNAQAIIEVKTGDEFSLVVTTDLAIGEIASISWMPQTGLSCIDCLSPTLIAPVNDTKYEVTVIDINGCEVVASIYVKVSDEVIVVAANTLKPSSFSGNDGFTIYTNATDAIINNMSIYDRWGNLVFENKDFLPNVPSLGWNGKFGNTEVVPGVFVCMASLTINGKVQVWKGDITVL